MKNLYGLTNIKTKFFNGTEKDMIEKAINDFIKDYDSNIIEIQFSTCESSYDCMVIYTV